MTVGPLAALRNASHKVVYNRRLLFNQLFCHDENARNEMRPNILRVVKNTATAVKLCLCRMWLSDEVSIDCMCCECTRHVWWWQFDKPDFINTDALILHQLANY